MNKKYVSDFTSLFFEDTDQVTAGFIEELILKTEEKIFEIWNFVNKRECRVYIMRSFIKFFFHSAPFSKKILLILFFPLWYFKAAKIWAFAGGWERSYKNRLCVGIKPPELIKKSNTEMGKRIFIQFSDQDKLLSVLAHELTHAFFSHLKLPSWLNEGLAMLSTDKVLERTTVLKETLRFLNHQNQKTTIGEALRKNDHAGIVSFYARSYWITRYIYENQRTVLQDIISGRVTKKDTDKHIAKAFETEVSDFWIELSRLAYEYFKAKSL